MPHRAAVRRLLPQLALLLAAAAPQGCRAGTVAPQLLTRAAALQVAGRQCCSQRATNGAQGMAAFSRQGMHAGRHAPAATHIQTRCPGCPGTAPGRCSAVVTAACARAAAGLCRRQRGLRRPTPGSRCCCWPWHPTARAPALGASHKRRPPHFEKAAAGAGCAWAAACPAWAACPVLCPACWCQTAGWPAPAAGLR